MRVQIWKCGNCKKIEMREFESWMNEGSIYGDIPRCCYENPMTVVGMGTLNVDRR